MEARGALNFDLVSKGRQLFRRGQQSRPGRPRPPAAALGTPRLPSSHGHRRAVLALGRVLAGMRSCVLLLLYYASMVSLLQIRNVPDGARRALKARAAARGESLNTYLLDVLEREAARPTVEEVLERAARRAERASASAIDVLEEARSEREGRVRHRRP